MDESKSNRTEIIAAFVAGSIIGLALGILFAPEKGNVTRSKVLSGAKDLADSVKNKFTKEADAMRTEFQESEKHAESKSESNGEKVKAERKV